MAYVSGDSTRPGRVVMVLINRAQRHQLVTVDGIELHGEAALYRIDGPSSGQQSLIRPVARGRQVINGSLKIDLPALSVTTIDVQ
jgi:hypothetical protein